MTHIQAAFNRALRAGVCTAPAPSLPCGKLAPLKIGTAPRCSGHWRDDRDLVRRAWQREASK